MGWCTEMACAGRLKTGEGSLREKKRGFGRRGKSARIRGEQKQRGKNRGLERMMRIDPDFAMIILITSHAYTHLKPPGMRGSACVEVMTTLHGSAPSLRRRAEGCDRTFVPCLDIPLWIRAEEEYFQDQDFYSQSGYSFVDQSRGQISSGFRYTRYGSAGVTVDQFTAAMASIQEALASLRQEISGQQGRPPTVQDETPYDSHPPPPPPPVPSVHQASPYVLHGHSEIAPPAVAQAVVADDTHARMDRIEQCMRQMRVSDGSVVWDDFGGMPVASLPAKFRMPDIERYTDDHLFPLSLSGAAQRWFASLESSRRRTWDDLAQEFLRQFSFNTVVDVSRRELEALRQRTEESVSSFISRWRGKIAEIVDRPSERDQIQMVLRSLQPRIARHVVGSRSQILGLWTETDRGWRYQFIQSEAFQTPSADPTVFEPHSSYASHQYRPRTPRPGIERPAVSYTATGQPCYAAQFTARPAAPYPRPGAQQTSAPFALRTQRQFSQIGMPLSQALRKLTEAGLLTALTPRPLPQPIPAQFRMDLHCAYHQGPGHETDRCTALRHAIQDLIDQGLVHLGQPSVTTNPLPTHTTHAVPPPAGGIHFLDFDETDDHVHMLSWDDPDPEPIMPAGIYETSGAPYILIPDVEEVRAPHVDISQTPDIQYILRGGRVMRQPPPAAARPVEGTSASQEEVRAEDDEILRQLQSTQARISIWSLLASSSTHRDALTRALSQIRVDTTTTPEGLIHMMTAGRATCIVFSDDDLPPEGSDHTRPLYISVGCSGRRVPSVLLDNGSALNVCPLATAIALGYAPSDFGPLLRPFAHMTVPREVMGTLEIELLIGPATFVAVFQVVVVQSVGDMFIAAEPVLEISHTDDDLFLTGFTFDEHGSTVVLDIMRSMSYLPGMGLGRRQHGPSEFIAIPDHDVPFGLGFIPTEADYLYMARLRKERVRARLTHTPFYYPLRPYTRSLADYFVRASEPDPCGRSSEDLAPPGGRASAPCPAVTIERWSPWSFDFCVDCSFFSGSHEPYDALFS
ncbi:hypothetical protein CK203_093141 [Vitis vinifera]|uniref:Retrotransposon gag domain-containing protein n=1 Tax=Vitis vinifera TaxID=29760 RepID=A0A438F4T4_VITVI|nr:hypothetical protein CK203_093141 [Vitis vinifera]